MIFALMLLLSVLNTSPASALVPMGMNDVSMLLPIPGPADRSLLISTADRGQKGALLPQSLYSKFKPVEGYEDAMIYGQALKVIAIRLDPCFKEGSETICHKQIRLVWQPLVEWDQKVKATDDAQHTFYEFGDAEWAQVLKDWAQISRGRLDEELQIQPIIKQQGFSGTYWKKVKAIVLKYCGEKSLVRLTGMREIAERMWLFSGFQLTQGQWLDMSIPRVSGQTTQAFFLEAGAQLNPIDFQGDMLPRLPNASAFTQFLNRSDLFKRNQSENLIKPFIQSAIRNENPRLENTGTLDCVSCHIAQPLHLWGQSNFVQWDWKNGFKAEQFESNLPLTNHSVNPFQTNRLRSFGYFETDPIFSQRVINESAAIVQYLNGQN